MSISKQHIAHLTKQLGVFHIARFAYRVARDPRYLYYYGQGRIVDPQMREHARALERSLFRRGGATRPEPSDPQLTRELRALREDALVRGLEFFSPNEVAELKAHLQALQVFDPSDADKRLFDPNQPRTGTRVGYYETEALARTPGVLAKANHPDLLALVGAYFGCPFRLNSVDCWWSYSDENADSYHTQAFHRDFDSLNFLKFFVYLTDVTGDTGPHVFVPRSHKAEAMVELGGRYTDSEVATVFGDRAVEIVGSAGTCFLANTFALHKGRIPTENPRLLLQFSYGVNMTVSGPRRPFLKRADFANPAGYPIDPYINKYFLTS